MRRNGYAAGTVRALSLFAMAAAPFWNFAFGRLHGMVLVRYKVSVLVNDMHRLTAP
jgi:hypothetical protein